MHLLAVCKPHACMHAPSPQDAPPPSSRHSVSTQGGSQPGLGWAHSLGSDGGRRQHVLVMGRVHASASSVQAPCMHACMQAPCNAQVCGGMRCHQPGEAGDPPRCIVRRHHHRLKRWALAGVAGGASICSQLVAHVWQAGSRLLQLASHQASMPIEAAAHSVVSPTHRGLAPAIKQASKQASKHASKQQQHITDDCAAVCMCCG
jgi:hypothetical protein